MVSVPDAAVGAVVAALIAGTISILGLIISKEQKTSEFRHAWIESLRSEIVEYLTHINAICDALSADYKDYNEKLETLRPLYAKLNNSNFSIQLRINPRELLSIKLLSTLEEFNTIARNDKDFNVQNVKTIEKKVILLSRDLLKYEWMRVKSGERSFKMAKFAAIVIIASPLVYIGMAIYMAWPLGLSAQPQAAAQRSSVSARAVSKCQNGSCTPTKSNGDP